MLNSSLSRGLILGKLLLARNQLGKHIASNVDDAFSGFGDLKTLDLSYNEIRTLPKSAFSTLRKLEYLNLSGNFLDSIIIIIIIIIIISLTSIFFQDKSRVWTAASQQHSVDKQPLATFWDLPFSHSDTSISRKSHLVTIRQLSIPGKVGAVPPLTRKHFQLA